jgi:hypothetical protein
VTTCYALVSSRSTERARQKGTVMNVLLRTRLAAVLAVLAVLAVGVSGVVVGEGRGAAHHVLRADEHWCC